MLSYYIQDILTGKSVSQYYKLYTATQWYQEDAMEALRVSKLRKLVEHCYLHVLYYKKHMLSIGMVPSDIKRISDVDNFPILTKEIIRSNYQEFIPDNLKYIKGVKSGYTGGTTGLPLLKRTDANTRSSTWALYARFLNWMDIADSDFKLSLIEGFGQKKGSTRSKLRTLLIDRLSHTASINTYDDYSVNKERIENILKAKNVSYIRSYTQFLYNLARDYKNEGKRFTVRAITTTAEPLLAHQREVFREVFSCETFDQYGCGEIGGLAFECDNHKGLHISEERAIVATDSDGKIIITDLDNYAMPYIRYMNDDEIELASEPCSCGRKSQLIKAMKGRVVDYLYGIEGQKLHSSYIWTIVFSTGIAPKVNLQKFQVHQVAQDRILFKHVSDVMDQKDKDVITHLLQEKLGNITIEFIREEYIENSASGKYRPIINDILR
ncbi:MAG: hypothetical protein RBS43_06490 [Candidatus Cloacimonas sp.]|nr:hypothetical protein [Candidatus Cloacimonas sp.]